MGAPFGSLLSPPFRFSVLLLVSSSLLLLGLARALLPSFPLVCAQAADASTDGTALHCMPSLCLFFLSLPGPASLSLALFLSFSSVSLSLSLLHALLPTVTSGKCIVMGGLTAVFFPFNEEFQVSTCPSACAACVLALCAPCPSLLTIERSAFCLKFWFLFLSFLVAVLSVEL